MIVWTNGWLWIIAALLLALIEMILPGYVFLGLAAAVGVMGVVLLAGLWGWGLPAALVVTHYLLKTVFSSVSLSLCVYISP